MDLIRTLPNDRHAQRRQNKHQISLITDQSRLILACKTSNATF